MRQLVLVAAGVLCALIIAPRSTDARSTAKRRGRAEVQPSVQRCVRYSQQSEEQGVTFALENKCGKMLDCKLSWAVRCKAKKAATEREDAIFTLASAEKHESYVSAAGCAGKGWSVDAIRWTCRAP